MMRKVYIIDDYQSSMINGIGTYIGELIYCLQQLKMEIFLVSFNSDTKEFNIIEKEDGVKVMLFPVFSVPFLSCYEIIDSFFRLYIEDSLDNAFFLNYFPCEKFLKKIKGNYLLSKFFLVIHNQLWTSELLGDNIKLQKIVSAKRNNIIEDRYKFLVQNFRTEQRTYNIADGIVCLSNDTRKVVEDLYKKRNNLYTIPHGCQDCAPYPISEQQKQEMRIRMNIHRKERLLIYVGRLSRAKGIDVLIKSFCRIVKRNCNVRLLIAGIPLNKEYYNYLFKISQEAISQISFLGQISHSKLKDWYSIADIGVFPSYTEQCSFTGIEMMMYGLPIVASDGFGVRNMFMDDVNAKVARIGENREEYEANLTDAITYLLNSELECRRLAKNARKTFELKYNVTNMLEGYKFLLHSLQETNCEISL